MHCALCVAALDVCMRLPLFPRDIQGTANGPSMHKSVVTPRATEARTNVPSKGVGGGTRIPDLGPWSRKKSSTPGKNGPKRQLNIQIEQGRLLTLSGVIVDVVTAAKVPVAYREIPFFPLRARPGAHCQ